ncbi:uncharacterized protein [Solanum lycopersicum]|uniref:ZF-HD dimerization-type domain-containing protein n=1 Tax=Solanum lycopersicum TaxID=4081 RepID=A0A3Q7I763_SOLLC|nr:uncharacterized protein LOC101258410 isoform X1 [Solanum lycopersicum]
MAAPQRDFNIENQEEPKSKIVYLNYRRVPAVIFRKKYWDWNSMVAVCKLTMVGKFFIPKPKMTKIRASFHAKLSLKGVVKIRSYDSYHVFIDFTAEEDYQSVLLKERVVVAGAIMEVFQWTPEFHDQFFVLKLSVDSFCLSSKKREAFGVVELENTKKDEHIGGGNEYGTEESDSVACVPEVTHSDSEDRVASPIKCETSKLPSSVGISCSEFSGLSSAPYRITGRIPSVTYESSSMCSTELVPFRGTYLNHNNLKSYSREWNYGSKPTSEAADLACETLSQPLYALSIVERHENQKSRPPIEVQHSTYMGYPTLTFPRRYGESLVSDYKLTLLGNFSYKRPKMKEIRADFKAQNPLSGQVKIRNCSSRQVLILFSNEEDYYTVLYKKAIIVAGALMQISWSSPDFHHEVKQNIHPDFRLSDAKSVNWNTDTSKLHPSINGLLAPATDEKSMSLQVPAVSQCLSVPSICPPLPLLAHSVSVAGRLCADRLTTSGIYVPQSYPKGIVGIPIFGSNEQAGSGNTFPRPSQALNQQSLAQQHNQLNSYKPNMTVRIAQLQPPSTTSVSDITSSIRYRECLKNHAASMGGHALDGCGEFMPSGEEGTPGALKCAACNCHQNFHRKEIDDYQPMDDVGSHSRFSQPRNNSSSGSIQNQVLISLPTQQYHHDYSDSCSPRSLVDSLQPYTQPPSPTSGSVYSQQALERIQPSSIRSSYSYEMVNHNTMQNGKQREYFWSDSSRNTSRDHPSVRNENWNFDMDKPLNNRTPDHIPLEFPTYPSRCQPQTVFTDEFPHLDIINNLLHEEHETGRTLMSNSGSQRLNKGS